MTLPECVEPFFLTLCRVRRLSRAGVSQTHPAAIDQMHAAIDRALSDADRHGRREAFERVRAVLRAFADVAAHDARLSTQDRSEPIARSDGSSDGGGLVGVSAMLAEVLRSGVADAEVLDVCRTLHALGQPSDEAARRAWRSLGELLREAGSTTPIDHRLITPLAYEHTDTRDLSQPALRRMVPMLAGVLGMLAVLALAALAMRHQATKELEATLDAIVADTGR